MAGETFVVATITVSKVSGDYTIAASCEYVRRTDAPGLAGNAAIRDAVLDDMKREVDEAILDL